MTVVDLVIVPLEAEMLTVYGPATEEATVQFDKPEVVDDDRVMLEGLHDTDRPDEGLTELVIVKVPLNPEVLARVSVALPEAPELKATMDGLAEIVKSWAWDWDTVTVMVVEWLKPFDEPTTVTVKVPATLELTVMVEDAEPFAGNVTLEALRERVGPEGDEEAESPIVPENPLRLVTVIVDEAELFARKLREAGLAEMEKSVTVTETDAVFVSDPLLPVRVTA